MKKPVANGWKEAKLGDYFRIKHGWAFKGEFFADAGPYVLLTPGNFKADGGLQERGEREKYYTGDFPGEFLLKRGEFLIVMTDLTQNAPILGSPAIVPENDRFLHNQRLGKVVDLKEAEMDKGFLYHLLNHFAIRAQIKGSATGATVKHTAPDRIYAVKAQVPPIPVQRAIAGVLAAYDELIENNTRRIKLLEQMAQVLYHEWFVRPCHSGYLPKGWETKKVRDLLHRLPAGNVYTEDEVKPIGSVPVIDQSREAILGYHDNDPDHLAKPDNPIIIFGDHTCKMQMMVEPFSIGPNVVPFVTQNGIPIAYVFFLVRNLVETHEYKRHWNVLTNKDVMVGPKCLADRFAESVIPMFEQTDCLMRKNSNLRRTRDLLLPKLISGEVDVERIESTQ